MTYSKVGQSALHEKYTGTYEVKDNILFLTLDDGMQMIIRNDGEDKYVFVEAVKKDGMIIRTSSEIVFTYSCNDMIDRTKKYSSLAEIFDSAEIIRARAYQIIP